MGNDTDHFSKSTGDIELWNYDGNKMVIAKR